MRPSNDQNPAGLIEHEENGTPRPQCSALLYLCVDFLSPLFLRDISQAVRNGGVQLKEITMDQTSYVPANNNPTTRFLSHNCRPLYPELSSQLCKFIYLPNLDQLVSFRSSIWITSSAVAHLATLPNLRVLDVAYRFMGDRDPYLLGFPCFSRLVALTIRFPGLHEATAFFKSTSAKCLKTLLIQLGERLVQSSGWRLCVRTLVYTISCATYFATLDLFSLRDDCYTDLTGVDKLNLNELLSGPSMPSRLLNNSRSMLSLLVLKRPSLEIDDGSLREILQAFPSLRLLYLTSDGPVKVSSAFTHTSDPTRLCVVVGNTLIGGFRTKYQDCLDGIMCVPSY